MVIDIPIFSGARPRVEPRLLEPTQAQAADNCKLDSGALVPLRRMSVEARLSVCGVHDVLRYNGAWLTFYEPVSLCRSTVNADELDRMYYTGETSGAMMFREAEAVGAAQAVRLGLPAPEAAPVVAVQGTGETNGDTSTSYYVWTWVSDLGEESAPSPASALFDFVTGQTLQVSGMVLPDLTGRNPAMYKRLYRGASGTAQTSELFVAEFPAAQESYHDELPSSALGESLVTEGWLPPPDGLQGLTAVHGGSLAGFLGNKVYISQPFAPYAYPHAYVQSLGHPVVALAATGNHLVVLTNAAAYLIPCDDVTATAPTKLEGYTPCAGPRGVVSMRQGVLFPGVDGLYLVGGGATTPTNLTAGVVSEEDWRFMRPGTFRAWGLGDKYICFCDDEARVKRGFIFDLARPSELIGLALHATCGWLEPEGRKLHLGFEENGRTTITLWEGHKLPYSAQWRSKVFRFPAPVHMAAARVEADFPRVVTEQEYETMIADLAASYSEEVAAGELGGQLGTARCGSVIFAGDILDSVSAPYCEVGVLAFQLFVDGREVYRRNVTTPAIFPLPPASGAEWEILVSGAVEVRRVTIATSMAELRAS